MLRRKRPASAAIGASAVLVLASCGASADPGGAELETCELDPTTCNSGERADGGEVTWAMDGSWSGWNPVTSEGNTVFTLQVLAAMWPSAGQFDQESQFVLNDGVLAEEPQLVSERPMQVEYRLNPDATWGDGTPIGLDDFIYNWFAVSGDQDRCAGCTPASASGEPIAGIDTEGSTSTVVITYDDDYASSEWKYEQVLSAPAHIADEAGFEWRDDPEAMKASQDHFAETVPTWSAGPYRITDAETGEYVVYEPNPEWAGSTRPTLDQVTIKSFESTDAIVTELRQGTVDGASPSAVTADHVVQLTGAEGLDFDVAPGPGWGHIDLNTSGEFLSDPALRTAVFQAIDVDNIIDRTYADVQPDATRKLNHLYREDSEHFEDLLTPTGQGAGDTDQARRTLQEAGYAWNDEGGLLDPDGRSVELDYRFAEGGADRDTMAQLVQFNLADIGIEVELDPFPVADLGAVTAESEFDMINFGWTSAPTVVGYANQYWASDSAANFGKNDDPELDALLDQLSSTRDPERAAAAANDVVARLIEDAYVLPTVDTPAAIMIADDLVGVRDNWASQQRALYNIAEWGLRAER